MSKLFSFAKATRRKTECYWLTLFGVDVLISYETPVAFRSHDGLDRFRQKNHWGPTTRRHMDADAYVWNWDIIDSKEEFEALLDRAILRAINEDKAMVRDLVAAAVADKLTMEPA